MKIVILAGSPHKKGTSGLLVEKFTEGALEKGHEISHFDVAFMNIKGCLGCNYCKKNKGECVQKDDMIKLYTPLIEADMIVFSTPLYYISMSAQLKTAIDRFYSINEELKKKPKEAILIGTCAAPMEMVMEPLKHMYMGMVNFLNWKNNNILIATGVQARADIEKTDVPEKAKAMGLAL